jgi:hypothetical protein
MGIIANIDYLEYLWNGELPEYEKYLVRGMDISDDGRNFQPLFTAGVYFLWNRDGLQYIGQTYFIWHRVIGAKHHVFCKQNKGDWIIGIIPIEDAKERQQLEAYCIKTFCPPRNRQHSGRR